VEYSGKAMIPLAWDDMQAVEFHYGRSMKFLGVLNRTVNFH